MSAQDRLFRALLQLYPAEFRTRYGDELLQLCADELRDARAPNAQHGQLRTLLADVIDVFWNGLAERVSNGGAPAPTSTMRFLGVLGIVGGVWLVSAFVVFIGGTVNVVRLVVFNLGAVAIAVAISRTWFDRLGGLGRAVASFVVVSNVVYAAMIVLTQPGRPRVFGEYDALIWMLAGIALWLADGLFGLVALRLPGLGRIGATALVLGSLAIIGISHLGLVEPGVDSLAMRLALAGVFFNGVGWILLGLVVAFRGRSVAALSEGSRPA